LDFFFCLYEDFKVLKNNLFLNKMEIDLVCFRDKNMFIPESVKLFFLTSPS